VFQPVVVGRQSEATAEIKEGLLAARPSWPTPRARPWASGMKVKVGR